MTQYEIKKLSTVELKKKAREYFQMTQVCFSCRDLLIYERLLKELEDRGYECETEMRLIIRKG